MAEKQQEKQEMTMTAMVVEQFRASVAEMQRRGLVTVVVPPKHPAAVRYDSETERLLAYRERKRLKMAEKRRKAKEAIA
jgi:hypothetical protein